MSTANTRTITTRLTLEQYCMLMRLAKNEEDYVSISEMIRRLIVEAYSERVGTSK